MGPGAVDPGHGPTLHALQASRFVESVRGDAGRIVLRGMEQLQRNPLPGVRIEGAKDLTAGTRANAFEFGEAAPREAMVVDTRHLRENAEVARNPLRGWAPVDPGDPQPFPRDLTE